MLCKVVELNGIEYSAAFKNSFSSTPALCSSCLRTIKRLSSRSSMPWPSAGRRNAASDRHASAGIAHPSLTARDVAGRDPTFPCPSRALHPRAFARGRWPVMAYYRPRHFHFPLHFVTGEVTLELEGPVTRRAILDALEAHDPPDAPLPEAIANGVEPFLVVGAMAGG